ncbi:MAG: hypothetical protein LBQ93_11615 [Treponema sp.]|jgi:hypothetical protein|nr:hypothetical protein [Treponema sp.]
MGDYKLYQKLPFWVFPGYILMLIFGLYNIATLIVNTEYRTIFSIVLSIIYMLMFSCGLCFTIAINFKNTCYFTINEKGISLNEFNLFKKNISWNSEIYYLITDSFFSLYSYKKMIQLQEKIINEHDIKHGYISFKIKDALKTKINNKGWICISTKWLKNNIQINDVVDKINIIRGKT